VFEHFVKHPFHLARYRNGPYAEERTRFLAYLNREGPGWNRLRVINCLLLEVAQQVALNAQKSYTADTLNAVARRWQKAHKSKNENRRQARIASVDFVFVASSWLRFLGRFDENAAESCASVGLTALSLSGLKSIDIGYRASCNAVFKTKSVGVHFVGQSARQQAARRSQTETSAEI
jgi:hypothetical protein